MNSIRKEFLDGNSCKMLFDIHLFSFQVFKYYLIIYTCCVSQQKLGA